MDTISRIQKNKAFTLIETLIAISIFSLSILGLLSVLSSGISNTGYAKKKIIASYLAQEGIEYMRNLRDTFVLYNGDPTTGWNSFNSKTDAAKCNEENGCYFDDQSLDYNNNIQPIIALTISPCDPSCPALFYDQSTGKYGYNKVGTTATDFIRKIETDSSTGMIRSTVFWTQGSGTYQVVLTEFLSNWVQ